MKSENSVGFWERMKSLLGEEFEAFREFQEKPLRKTIRVNLLKNSISEFLQWAKSSHPDWILTPHPFAPEIFYIDRASHETPLGKSLGHISGRFYIQEASSAIPPRALFSFPHEDFSELRVLDAASAPGSKTTQIAAKMGNKGLLVANEFSASRSKILVFNLQKCGVANTILTHFSAEKFGIKCPNFFDRILLDAPCTGEGTFRKDKNALENWSLKNILAAAKLQKTLIQSAFQALRPGGVLIYSTCTLAPEENESVVDFLQKQFPESVEIADLRNLFPGAEHASGLSSFEGRTFLDGEKMLRIFPHSFDSEGFFVAAIRKKIPSEEIPKTRFSLHGKKLNGNVSIQKWSDKTARSLVEFLRREFEFDLPRVGVITQKNADLYWTPPHSEMIFAQLKIERPGLKLVKMTGREFRLSHEAAIALGGQFRGKRVVEISPEEAVNFLRGENISDFSSEIPLGDVVIFCEGMPIGVAKNIGKVLKNNMPRNFLKTT